MKKALILGTGAAQVDAIRHLKSQGWWVMACSYLQEGPGLKYIDHFELVNITDVDKVVEIAREHHVTMIYSVGSDLAMLTVAQTAPCLGLPTFISLETARLMQDKTLLRDFLADKGISPVRYRRVAKASDIECWDIFPSMVKPADSQGQRGVYRAETLDDLFKGLNKALDASRTHTAIIEEFLQGPEVSANVFVVNGNVIVNEISDRLVVDNHPGGIPRGHVLTANSSSAEALANCRRLVEQCVKVLGIDNGPAYFQLKLTPDGPRIVEITPRLDGCHIWRLIREVRGIDLLDASLNMLAGNSPGLLSGRERPVESSLMFFLTPPGEKFFRHDHPAPRDAVFSEYYLEDGQIIPPINGHLEKVGYFIQRGKP